MNAIETFEPILAVERRQGALGSPLCEIRVLLSGWEEGGCFGLSLENDDLRRRRWWNPRDTWTRTLTYGGKLQGPVSLSPIVHRGTGSEIEGGGWRKVPLTRHSEETPLRE